jgi:phosphoenolpyruvate-protein phosphotransferase
VTAEIRGVAAAPGTAIGPVHLIERQQAKSETRQTSRSPEEERKRLHEALGAAQVQLSEIAQRVETEIGSNEAGIFVAQGAFATDPALVRRAEGAVDAGSTAEAAVEEAFEGFRREIEASGNEYLAARATDLDDVKDRVVGLLRGSTGGVTNPEVPSVVVAEELTPSQTAEFRSDMVLAIATELGTATSHAAILARALGIPSVVGAQGLLRQARTGVDVAVDGTNGLVYIDPDDATRRRLQDSAAEGAMRRKELDALRSFPGSTADGRRVELAANLGSLAELEGAVAAGAEGCGLVRTEFLFQARTTAPSVEEQTEVYRKVLAAFPGKRVVFRTLDVGADKPLPFVSRSSEPNPALGVRGIRLGLAQPDLLRDQLRAIVRACREAPARGAVMFPMVAASSEIDEALAMLTSLSVEEDFDLATLEVGAMIETPVAALNAARLARELDFVSVGTNDLLQYLFAADRLDASLAELPDLFDPGVLRLLAGLVEGARAEGAWVGVCGEAAGTALGAALFVGLGCDELSMAAGAIGEVKHTLRSLTMPELQDACRRALSASDASAARHVFRVLIPGNRGSALPSQG